MNAITYLTRGGRQWRRLSVGVVGDRPAEALHDATIARLRMDGLSLSAIGDQIGKRKSYVQHRLARIACREAWDEEHTDMEWDDARVQRLRELWDYRDENGATIPTEEIGRRMGCTKSAAVGKAHRLGLEPRESPIKRSGYNAAVRREAAAQRALSRKQTVPALPARSCQQCRGMLGPEQGIFCSDTCEALHAGQKPQQVLVVAEAVVRKPREPKPAPYLSVKQCCWVEGEKPRWRYCDQPTVSGSWCAEHLGRVFVKRERKEAA